MRCTYSNHNVVSFLPAYAKSHQLLDELVKVNFLIKTHRVFAKEIKFQRERFLVHMYCESTENNSTGRTINNVTNLFVQKVEMFDTKRTATNGIRLHINRNTLYSAVTTPSAP